METKLRDRAWLSTYSLDTRLFACFGLTVLEASPVRAAFLLTTNDGGRLLRRMPCPASEVLDMDRQLEGLSQGYPWIVRFRKALDGLPYTVFKDAVYTVVDELETREPDFSLEEDVRLVGRALAGFHRAGQRPAAEEPLSSRCETLLARLGDYRRIALLHENKSPFDLLFQERLDDCLAHGLEALEELRQAEARAGRNVLCHHGLSPRNLRIDGEGRLHFTGFEHMVTDPPCHDLANLIRKSAVPGGHLTALLEAYEQEAGWKVDLRLLHGLLLFPYDFIRVSDLYYARRRQWEEEEHCDRLRRRLADYDERIPLLSGITK